MDHKASCLYHYNKFGVVREETVHLYLTDNNEPIFRQGDNCGNYPECEECKDRSIKWYINYLLEQSSK